MKKKDLIKLGSQTAKGDIIFPLKEAPYLVKVKKGELDYLTEVAPILEDILDEVEQLSKNSKLSEKVNRKYWNNFIIKKLEEQYENLSNDFDIGCCFF